MQGRSLCLCLWVWVVIGWGQGGAAWAQASKVYLEACSPLECAAGFNCAIKAGDTKGICLHECNALQPNCPNGEACVVQGNGAGACVCKDGECGAPMTCKEQQCSGLLRWNDPCSKERPCERGLLCVGFTGETVPRCRPLCTGGSCGSGETCTPLDPNDLQSFRVCLCRSNDDCPEGSACQAGRCLRGLSLGEVCSDRNVCQSTLACAKIGATAADTSCVARCAGSKCVGGESCQTLTTGLQACICSDALPCPAGLACQRGICVRGTTPLCNSVFSCPTGRLCIRPLPESDLGLCLAACSAQGSCNNGSPCISLAHTKVCACTEDSQCPSGSRCLASQCTSVCKETSECPAGQICDRGGCIPSPPEVVKEGTSEGTTEGATEATTEKDPDASVPDTSKETRPSLCNPPCQAPFRCANGLCVKLEIGDDCATSDQCESGLCFGREKGRKICSVADCSKCKDLGLTCQTFESGQGCFFQPATIPDVVTPGSCNCQAFSPWPLGFFFLTLLFLFPQRRRR